MPIRPQTRNSVVSLQARRSGVLLHPTSLPGPLGIGDLGPSAYEFVLFLERAGQSWWQMLPVGPTGPGDSPYASPSMFAGSPLLISPQLLVADGLLTRSDIFSAAAFAKRAPGRGGRSARRLRPTVDYRSAGQVRDLLLIKAFEAHRRRPKRWGAAFEAFRHESRAWLDDYALYCALKAATGQKAWHRWPAPLRQRRPGAMARARAEHADAIEHHAFVQFLFARQFAALRLHCQEHGVGLLGDIPIFVAHDSADVWTAPGLFELDRAGNPTAVAGVPPDYFSELGQRWGNPLYRWRQIKSAGYSFWIDRMRAAHARFDAVRLDHFIGFVRYYSIPADAPDARTGTWCQGPGAAVFEAMRRAIPDLMLVAEDLGAVTPAVTALRDALALPGMQVVQFSFNPDDDGARPYRYPANSVVYTGTHDNDTTVGWLRSLRARHPTETRTARRAEYDTALAYAASDGRLPHRDMLRVAWSSPSNIAIAPIQDIVGLGTEARMNLPGTAVGNWRFRLRDRELKATHARELGALTQLYGRQPR